MTDLFVFLFTSPLFVLGGAIVLIAAVTAFLAMRG